KSAPGAARGPDRPRRARRGGGRFPAAGTMSGQEDWTPPAIPPQSMRPNSVPRVRVTVRPLPRTCTGCRPPAVGTCLLLAVTSDRILRKVIGKELARVAVSDLLHVAGVGGDAGPGARRKNRQP